MTIVLGVLDSIHYDACVGEDGFTLSLLRTLARHAPLDFLRFMKDGEWVEMLRDGTICSPRDPDGFPSLEQEPGDLTFVAWSFGDIPERWPDMSPLILPRRISHFPSEPPPSSPPWDFAALRQEPTVARLLTSRAFQCIDPISSVDLELACYDDERCGHEGLNLLESAEIQHIVLTYG